MSESIIPKEVRQRNAVRRANGSTPSVIAQFQAERDITSAKVAQLSGSTSPDQPTLDKKNIVNPDNSSLPKLQ